jgi:hypothetical protein
LWGENNNADRHQHDCEAMPQNSLHSHIKTPFEIFKIAK